MEFTQEGNELQSDGQKVLHFVAELFMNFTSKFAKDLKLYTII